MKRIKVCLVVSRSLALGAQVLEGLRRGPSEMVQLKFFSLIRRICFCHSSYGELLRVRFETLHIDKAESCLSCGLLTANIACPGVRAAGACAI